jgi:hypothetical protein
VGKDIDWDYIRSEFPHIDFSTTAAVDAVLVPYFARLRKRRDTAQADRNAERQDGATRLGPKDESPVP